jgi:hypothetical protein
MHKDADPKQHRLDPSDPIRLEPGDNVTAELYLWPTLAADEHGTRSGAIHVRGSAHAVGRKWSMRSRRRYAWKIPSGAGTHFTDVDVTPELRVFRELWWQNHREGIAASWALLMYREINKRLAKGVSRDEIQEFLDEGTKRLDDDGKIIGNAMVAYRVHHLYHHETPALSAEPKPTVMSRVSRALWGQTGKPPGR